MTEREPWALAGSPLALRHYVAPAEVASYLTVPGPSGDSRRSRLRRVFTELAERKIGYVYDDPDDEDDRQTIRSPEQVLWAPRHGTCLDLAIVFAAACLHTGLHPILAVVDDPAGGAGHVLVLVRLDHDRQPRPEGPSAQDVWKTLPAHVAGQLGDGGKVVAIDPVSVAVSLGSTRTRGLQASFDRAVAAGMSYLVGERAWNWRVGVDLGSCWRPNDAPTLTMHPRQEPLRHPYRKPEDAPSPLRLLRAEYGISPFQSRDELTILRDFAVQTTAGDRTGLAVIHGIGGSGKTRLALELAERLRRTGWYAGILPRDHSDVGWLAATASPLLVVVDYADGRVDTVSALLAALRGRPRPAVVVLTARSIDGEWLPTIITALEDDRHAYWTEYLSLPDQHPRPARIFQATATAVAERNPDVEPVTPPVPERIRWTTLDLVLLGWMAGLGGPLPTSRGGLYDEALRHEQNYWCEVYSEFDSTSKPERALLGRAAACLSLLVPVGEDATDEALCTLTSLAKNETLRRAVRRTLTACLEPGPGDGLALRPDPVGDHLLLRELAAEPDLLLRVAEGREGDDLGTILTALNRAGQNDELATIAHLTALVDSKPGRWHQLLHVAARQTGSALTTLHQLAEREPHTPLPLEQLSEHIPFSSLSLYRLGLIVDRRRLGEKRRADPPDRELAELLLIVSRRAELAGDLEDALAFITEAVVICRQLTEAHPGAISNLATSLNNLAGLQSDTGNRDAALLSINEAVAIRRQLASNDSAALPDLVASLNNLATKQSDAGDLESALASITEAVLHQRRLTEGSSVTYLYDRTKLLTNLASVQQRTGDREGALASIIEAAENYRIMTEADPTKFLPELALALNNMAIIQAESGDREGALASITEAVRYRRQMTDTNSAAFIPDLALSLNNLALRRADVGDRDGALASSSESVQYYRQLVESNSAAFLPGLSQSLNTLASMQSGTGDRDGALVSITEAVAIRRKLADVDSAAYLPDFAMSLNNLSNRQADAGDRDGALASITEGVEHCRQLADTNSAAYLPNLATSLITLSSQQFRIGDRDGALVSITEAVEHYRQLADNSAAYLPNLAASLNNLSGHLSSTGVQDAALTSIEEAVAIRRQLVDSHPAAFLPDLAESLNNLAAAQSNAGDRHGAVIAITEAVAIRRQLSDAHPAAYLPDLASSLDSMSGELAEIGDEDGALASIAEAVAIRRQLGADNPAAYLPNLAGSLVNLSSRQFQIGSRRDALASITEAVQYLRQLTASSPASFRADLATALSNLSIQLDGVGNQKEALAAITEAVQICRELAAVNSTRFSDDLATSLLNLSNRQSNDGDHASALASITEAVAILRHLADANPAGFLDKLAMALNNLSNQQSENGDLIDSLTSITESVQYYIQLVDASPAKYLPYLASAMLNLSIRYSNSGSEKAARQIWSALIKEMRSASERSELTVAWARWMIMRGDKRRAVKRLRSAAELATEPSVPNASDGIVLLRARRSIREMAEELDWPKDLPAWANAQPLLDAERRLLRALVAGDWDSVLEAARDAPIALESAGFGARIEVMEYMVPGEPGLTLIRKFHGEVLQDGLEKTVLRRQADQERRAVLDEWIATETWNESFAFLRDNFSILGRDDTRALLKESDDKADQQHLAILDLASHTPLDRLHALIADSDIAEEAALDALEAGNLARVASITLASAALRSRLTSFHLIGAVFAALSDELEAAEAVLDEIRYDARPIQCRAYAVRLRGLLRHQPSLSGLEPAISRLERPDD